MPDNRFEQVDEVQPDALNLTLCQAGDGQNGAIHIPVAAMTLKMPKPIDSGDMPVKDAFRLAIKLANDMKLPVVVIDHDNVWNAEWGTLYRHVEPDEAEGTSGM